MNRYVWIVQRLTHADEEIVGVYANEALAQEAVDTADDKAGDMPWFSYAFVKWEVME